MSEWAASCAATYPGNDDSNCGCLGWDWFSFAPDPKNVPISAFDERDLGPDIPWYQDRYWVFSPEKMGILLLNYAPTLLTTMAIMLTIKVRERI